MQVKLDIRVVENYCIGFTIFLMQKHGGIDQKN